MPVCTSCGTSFNITGEDGSFYRDIGPEIQGKRFGVPPPSHCFHCRLQRRLAFRNERHLYRRHCSFSGKEVISNFSPAAPCPVYAHEIWHSEQWEPLAYARDYDQNRTFFSQFKDLLHAVPQPARVTFIENENSDYCNYNLGFKDSYLCFWGDYNQESAYCYQCVRIKNCIECFGAYECEQCFRLVKASNCTNSHSIFFSWGISDSAFLFQCRDCHHCFQCTNLRHRSYCIGNEQYSKEEYERTIAEIHLERASVLKEQTRIFDSRRSSIPVLAVQLNHCEDCTGHDIGHSKNCHFCFCFHQGNEHCSYCVASGDSLYKVYDCYGSVYDIKNSYEILSATFGCQDVAFSFNIKSGRDVFYSANCAHCHDVFGCVGLTRKSYCILNKQYTKETYLQALAQIIPAMVINKEWGEFFPMELALFSYDETPAQDQYPLSQKQAQQRGARWFEHEMPRPEVAQIVEASSLPDSFDGACRDLSNCAIRCAESGKAFRLTKMELAFYRDHGLALPRLHPNLRIERLMRHRQPFNLWQRKCAHCGELTDSAYEPENTLHIWCEKCYNEDALIN